MLQTKKNTITFTPDPEATRAAGDADERQNLQKTHAFQVGVFIMILLQITTHLFTRRLYSEASKEQPIHQAIGFWVGVSWSMALFLTVLVASCCSSCFDVDILSKRAIGTIIGGLAGWTGLCCAVSFGSMVQCFPQICSFYNAVGVLGDDSSTRIDFTHIDCPRLLGGVPLRVVATALGHTYAFAAIGVLGGLAVVKPKLSPVIPRLAIDFVDLQDFALLLIDDEILKTFWGKAEEGYGGEWLWRVIFVNVIVAVLVMFADLVSQYVFTTDEEAASRKVSPQQAWGTIDNIVNFNSLVCIESWFLVWRVYTSWRFDVAPSPMVLKNVVSIYKEVWELYHQRPLRLGFYGTVCGTDSEE